jgi:hypothetical protein
MPLNGLRNWYWGGRDDIQSAYYFWRRRAAAYTERSEVSAGIYPDGELSFTSQETAGNIS